MTPQFRRVAGRAGMLAPVVFLTGVTLITWAEYEFMSGLGWTITDHGDSAWPSGLAQGPHGWAQIANFALTGILLLTFFIALRKEFRNKRSRRAASALLLLLGAGFVLAAFPEDGPPFGEPQTLFGILHGIGFIAIVLASFGAPLATAFALRGDERWRGYPFLSALAAVAIFVFMFLLVFLLEVATTIGIYGFFLCLFGWIELVAFRFWRLVG